MIRTCCTLVDHYTVCIDTAHTRIHKCIDTDSHILICICMHTDCKYTGCTYTNCMDKDCKFADCTYTNCNNADCITMDCINANHVDTCNHDTIFCDTFDCAYEYARVMLSLDFDNVKSNKSSSNIPGSIFAGLLLAPMAYQISCRQGLVIALLTQKFL
jgi:hypothetical protein